MKPDKRFLQQDKSFWANVRTISELLGYTNRGVKQIKIPTLLEAKAALQRIGLNAIHIIGPDDAINDFGQLLFAYFEHRAHVLNSFVEPRLMDVDKAREVFDTLRAEIHPTITFSKNKQKGEKQNYAFFTGIINMLVEANAEGLPWNSDPRKLTTFTRYDAPLRTLARRVDGAFTSTVNPIAIWEIKEYYYTTTFGSRVADGVYETLLDGMEIEELHEHEQVDVLHYLMLDSHNTWWNDGRSYLCRLIDMLHMGYVDEVLFGYEVVERLPSLVKEWVELVKSRPDLHHYNDNAMIVQQRLQE